MKKVIFVHGYTASSQADWYPNISKELDKLGVDYSILDLPGGEYLRKNDWLEIIDKEAQAASKPIILVGHSLGTRAILLYLEQYQPKNIDTVILIASFNNDWEKHRLRMDEHYDSFFEHAVDVEKVKKLANQFIVMHSKDDPDLKYEWGVEMANDLEAKLITYEDRDHFHMPENYMYVLEVIKTVL